MLPPPVFLYHYHDHTISSVTSLTTSYKQIAASTLCLALTPVANHIAASSKRSSHHCLGLLPYFSTLLSHSRAGLDSLSLLLIALLSSNGILLLLLAGLIRLTIAPILPRSEHRWFVNVSISPNPPHQHCRLVASSGYVRILLLLF